MLFFAAGIEKGSEHTLASAIVDAALAQGISNVAAEAFESITGKGVKGRVEGHAVSFGNIRVLDDAGIDPGALRAEAEKMRTVMFVTVDDRAIGLLGVADPIKDTTPEAIKQLHEERIRIVMLTGDNKTTADPVERFDGKPDLNCRIGIGHIAGFFTI